MHARAAAYINDAFVLKFDAKFSDLSVKPSMKNARLARKSRIARRLFVPHLFHFVCL